MNLFTLNASRVQKLEKKGVLIKSVYAKNGEEFAFEELRDFFNIIIDFYNYYNNLSASLSKLEPEDIDYEYVFDKIKEKTEIFGHHFATTGLQAADKYNVLSNILFAEEPELNKKQYYDINANSYSTKESRDAYEQSLLNKLRAKIHIAEEDIKNSEEAIKMIDRVIDTISSYYESLRWLDGKLEYYLLENDMLNPYSKAKNNELFYTRDIRDSFNYAIDMYAIIDRFASDIYDKWLENEKKRIKGVVFTGTETITIDLDNYRSPDGYTLRDLCKANNLIIS